jgi:signal transduction histidine kinase
LYGSGFAPDSLRQLVHELRTPLNAIIGFAEMIEGQLLGPAAIGYRTRAADIVAQGRRLLAAVDDLDMAARAGQHRLGPGDGGAVDGAALLTRLHGEYERGAIARGVRLDFRIAQSLPPIKADPVAVERMMARLLSATIGLAQRGETMAATLDRMNDTLRLSVARPAVLAGRDERALLDPGYTPEGDWPEAPALGLGFALRLIRNLATEAGGSFETGELFVLRLPAEVDAALESFRS